MKFVKILMPVLIFSGGSAFAQINVLCQAAERWTFQEEIGRPTRWAFSTSIAAEGTKIIRFETTGMPMGCDYYSGLNVNDEGIWFNCHQTSPTGEKFVFYTKIDRLSGDFIIRGEWENQSHLDGVTIGRCQEGKMTF